MYYLKEIRKQKKITQESMAEDLNVDVCTVKRWEKNTGYPSICKLVRIADYLKVNPRNLMGEDEETPDIIISQKGCVDKSRLVNEIKIDFFYRIEREGFVFNILTNTFYRIRKEHLLTILPVAADLTDIIFRISTQAEEKGWLRLISLLYSGNESYALNMDLLAIDLFHYSSGFLKNKEIENVFNRVYDLFFKYTHIPSVFIRYPFNPGNITIEIVTDLAKDHSFKKRHANIMRIVVLWIIAMTGEAIDINEAYSTGLGI